VIEGLITSARPADVAREVEALRQRGCTAFTLRSIDRGGMLDLERIGAARYAAGLQASVRLELEVPVAASARAR
jgi:L-alanine-DL-glutamate epimerase-like enolase superfamily enzyme